jgi:hypothetical protein
LSSTHVSSSATSRPVCAALRASPWCTPASRRVIKRPWGIAAVSRQTPRTTWRWRDLYDLYLNLVGPPTPLFQAASFQLARNFALREYVVVQHPELTPCTQGESWAPSLVVLFLAKDPHELPEDSYATAVEAFQDMEARLPSYLPM